MEAEFGTKDGNYSDMTDGNFLPKILRPIAAFAVRVAIVFAAFSAMPAAFAQEPGCLLCIAAAEGDEEEMARLLESGESATVTTQFGATPMHYAARHGRRLAAAFLFENGARLDRQDDRGLTPMMAAAAANQSRMVMTLLNLGANDTITDNNGWSPLLYAARYGYTKVISVLLAPRSFVAPANPNPDPDMRGPNGMTPLMAAAAGGQLNAAVLLIRQGAAVNAQDDNGASPLMFAVHYGQSAMMTLLAERGAAVTVFDNQGRHPILIAGFRREEFPEYPFKGKGDEPWNYLAFLPGGDNDAVYDNFGFEVIAYLLADPDGPPPGNVPLSTSLQNFTYTLSSSPSRPSLPP